MIRIYILEDDPSIIHNLTQIITSEKLGIICGDSADGMPSTARSDARICSARTA